MGHRAEYRFIGQSLASAGVLTLVADYRLSPQVAYPAFVQDSAAAVRWALAHVAEYGGDPQRLYIMGHSAGAMNVALLALDDRYLGADRSRLAGALLLASPVKFDPEPDLKSILYPPGHTLPSPMPLDHVDGSNPPIHLFHGEDDDTVTPAASQALWAAILRSGGQANLTLYPGIGHELLVGAMARRLEFLAPVRADVLKVLLR
jgi:acetyl esterase/lipase